MLNEKTINYVLVILTRILTLIIIFKFIIKDNKASLLINVKKLQSHV